MPSFVPPRGRAAFDLSTTLFIASLFCMLLAEAFMIRGLWFRPTPASHRLHGFDLPFLTWIPAFGSFIFLQAIRKRMREDRISPKLAASLSTGLTLLSLIAYLLITRFAQIAFR